jgi:hypothetical protein
MAKDLTTQQPVIPTAYDEELLQKRRAVRIRQTQLANLQLHFRDENGKPCDLTDYDFTGSSTSSESVAGAEYRIQARFREATESDKYTYVVNGTMEDIETGLVQCQIPQTQVANVAGIWLAEFGILNDQDCLISVTDCYVYVEKSGWGTGTVLGPPQVQTIRQALADDDPIINELIDNKEFDLGDITYAVIRTVQDWNDTPPPIANAKFTTKNFPFRDIWLLGTKVYLIQRAAMHYTRNFYPYNAGGMTRDDKNKHREYNAAWQTLHQEYRQRLIHKKVEINAARGFTSHRSGYEYTGNSAIRG